MDLKKGRLLSGRILVLPDEPPKNIGSILLPDNAKEKPTRGRVIAVAPEPHRFENGIAAPQECKAGDHVVYGRYAGIDFEDGKVTYKILAYNDVFMVLPE